MSITVTGSASNSDLVNILPGMPIKEDTNGNVLRANPGDHILAVATAGNSPGNLVNFSTEGVIERRDWFPIILTAHSLIQGQVYYVGKNGSLTTTGTQMIGIARSATVLRLKLQNIEDAVAQLFTLSSPPTNTLGTDGDMAFDATGKAFYFKGSNGWSGPYFLATTPPSLTGQLTIGDPTSGATLLSGAASYDNVGNLWIFDSTGTWQRLIKA